MFTKKRIYLDLAAGADGNPSSPHAEGRAARAMLEDARTRIARLLEVQADDILFTSGATESNALAILGVVRAGRARGVSPHVLYLPSAHASLVENVKLLEREGAVVEALPIRDGRVDTEALAHLLRSETVLVTMEAVCGETGTIWNTREVAEVIRRHRQHTSLAPSGPGSALGQPVASISVLPVLHVDASQAPWTENSTRAHFGADLVTFDGAKVGVRGIGLLVAHRTLPLEPLYRGGGQERGLRPGGEAPHLARALAESLARVSEGREAFRARAEGDRMHLLSTLVPLTGWFVNEASTHVPNVVNLSFPGLDTDYLVALLDEAGFAVSTKSACETDSSEGSRSVLALTGDAERSKATLRVSWGPAISRRDLTRFGEALVRSVGFLREH